MKNIAIVSSENCENGSTGKDGICVTVEKTFRPHEKNVYSVLVFDNRHVFSCSLDGMLRVWEFQTKFLLNRIRLEGGAVRDLMKWDDCTFIANGYRGIHIFEVLEKHPYCRNIYTIYNDLGTGIEFSKLLRIDEDNFLSTTIRGNCDILIVNFSQRKVVKSFDTKSNCIKWYTQLRRSKIYPNCVYLNLGSKNDDIHGIICLYNYEKGEVFSKFNEDIELIVFSMEIMYKSSQRKEYLILGGSQKSILVFDVSDQLPNGKLVKTIKGENWIYSLLNVCDSYLTVGLDSGHIEIFDFNDILENLNEENRMEIIPEKKRRKFLSLEKRDWVVSMGLYEVGRDVCKIFCGSSKEFSLVKVEGLYNLKNFEEEKLQMKDVLERIIFLREKGEEKVMFFDEELTSTNLIEIRLSQLTIKPIFRFLLL